MNTSLSLSASDFLITSLQLILGQKQHMRGRVSKKKRKEREGGRKLKAQSWKSNATMRLMFSMAQIQRQHSKVTLQSVDNAGMGSCSFRKVKALKLHF